MHLTVRTSTSASPYDSNGADHRTAYVSGIYSELVQPRSRPSPTPSWRKPDPSQWRYESGSRK